MNGIEENLWLVNERDSAVWRNTIRENLRIVGTDNCIKNATNLLISKKKIGSMGWADTIN